MNIQISRNAGVKAKIFLKISIVFLCFVILGYIVFYLFLYYLSTLGPYPNVRDYKAIPLPESSVIYDRNGIELYRVYEEKRSYVNYDDISSDMINAIVSGEDKRFWEHPGYDAIGISRAIIVGLINRKPFAGTSGITQQLARVTYLSDERTIKRKLRELHLSLKIESIFGKQDILELYLNKIFFGGNSYGVEQASQTYFHKSAANLGVFESSILASLPKAPTGLSPYNNKAKLLGYPIIESQSGTLEVLSQQDYELHSGYIESFKEVIDGLQGSKRGNNIEICKILNENIEKFIINKTGCIELRYSKLSEFLQSLIFQEDEHTIQYKTGRKDYILARMLQDGYISFDQYKQSIIQGFGYEFYPYRDDINSPHFVLYIKQQLIEKYGEEIVKKGGLKIYTTLDKKLQDKALELVENQIEKNKKKYGANNAAMISVDNKTGQVISFIGGADYFNDDIAGKNNMIFAQLQPGSTFKPFIYSLAMIKHGYDRDTIFTDEEFTFPGDYTPENSDGKYMGRMTLSKALNHSRNIPAVKAYYAAGEEENIIDFLEPFGISGLREFKQDYKKRFGIGYVYAAPMALGTVQVSPWELAQAYSVYANGGIKRDFSSILRVEDNKGEILDDFTITNNTKRVLTESQAFEMNYILSSTHKRPKDWNYFLTIPERKMAAKTGTSSKQRPSEDEGEDDIVEPRDLWTVGYTPQITTVVWAGNADGSSLKEKAYGITGAGPIMRDFMKFAHEGLDVQEW